MKRRIFGLDLLRAIAIFSVLLSHSRFLLTPYWKRFEVLRLGGFLGVELFFVLSGFLIGKILIEILKHEKKIDLRQLKHFWIRRWFRTLPNYYLFFLINLCMVKSGRALESTNPIPFLFFSQNLAWAPPDFFPISWSLSIEEWFYFSFPLALTLVVITLRKRGVAFLLTALVFILLPTALRLFYVIDSDPVWREVRQVVVYRIDTIMFGVLMSFIKAHSTTIWVQYQMPAFGIGALLVLSASVIFLVSDLNYGIFVRTGLFTITSLGFALLLPVADGLRPDPSIVSRIISKVAIWSYSMYLAHTLVIESMGNVAAKLHRPNLVRVNFIVDVLAFLISYAVCIYVSSMVYRYFEKPITNLREHLT